MAGHPPPGSTPLIDEFSLTLHSGERCLLVGSNGAGKTTLLKIIGGKHMVEQEMVKVLGRSAIHDTALTASGDLSYLGGEWRREVAFAGFEVPIQMEISAEKMIFGVAGIHPQRREKLIKVSGIDLSWRMHKVSDGQRRRVQICMGLLKPFKVLLLDEITVDLDVLARSDLLRFLKKECEERGATIIYATHIFDGLEGWPSHIRTVETWLRKEGDDERQQRKERKANGTPECDKKVEGSRVAGDPARTAVRMLNNGWAAGRLNSTVAGEESFSFSLTGSSDKKTELFTPLTWLQTIIITIWPIFLAFFHLVPIKSAYKLNHYNNSLCFNFHFFVSFNFHFFVIYISFLVFQWTT